MLLLMWLFMFFRRSDDDDDSSGGNEGGGDFPPRSSVQRNHIMANGNEPPLGCRPYSPVAKTLVSNKNKPESLQ